MSVCDKNFSFTQVSSFNLNLQHLKYVDKAAAELWVEVQIEQMSFVLLLLQNLTKARLDAYLCFYFQDFYLLSS